MTQTAFGDARHIAGAAPCRPASFVQFPVGEPQMTEADGTPTWVARGANFVVAVSLVRSGAMIDQDIADESMVLLSPVLPVTVATRDETATVDAEALIIVPPGPLQLTARSDGVLIRIFSSAANAFAASASNADDYRTVDDVAPLAYWPEPAGGYRLRIYRLAEFENDVGFGRLFRSTNLMVNVFTPSAGARDPSRLSPHDHADFEQGSLTLAGEFTHYLRAPWGPDKTLWQADRAQTCSGHSLMVIPPRMIHTTSWSGAGARLVDIFAPPRADFSARPGWVRNAADYPMLDCSPSGEVPG